MRLWDKLKRPIVLAFFLAVSVTGLLCCGPALVDNWVASKYRPQQVFDTAIWISADLSQTTPTSRQRMIQSLVTTVLPGKNRAEILHMLGNSPTHAEMRRHRASDFRVREKDERGNWKPFPQTGVGYYWDEFDWDLIYNIGTEQILVHDHKGRSFSPDGEMLIIRLDSNEVFSTWYIDGSTRWPQVVGDDALRTFSRRL